MYGGYQKILGSVKDMLDTDIFEPINSFFNSMVCPSEKLINTGD